MKTIRTVCWRPRDQNQAHARGPLETYPDFPLNRSPIIEQLPPIRLSAWRQTVRALAFREAPVFAFALCFPSLTDSRLLASALPLPVASLETWTKAWGTTGA